MHTPVFILARCTRSLWLRREVDRRDVQCSQMASGHSGARWTSPLLLACMLTTGRASPAGFLGDIDAEDPPAK